MYKVKLSVLVMVLMTLACTQSEPPAPQPEKTPEPVAQTEPPGYTLVGAETDFSFVIVSNSAGPVTGRFPNGASGTLDPTGAGNVEIQLALMKSLDKTNTENPLRDANVVEAFFGVRPSRVMREPVDKAWALLTDKLERSVTRARFEIEKTEGIDVADGTQGEGSMTGNLVLWNKISIPLTFPVSTSRTGNRVELVGTAPVSFDLEEVLGSELRKLLFDTMLAAGCAHQPGIQNQVEITIARAVFTAN